MNIPAPVLIIVALAALGLIGVQQYRVQVTQHQLALLRQDLDAAEAQAAQWRALADQARLETAAQAALGKSCLEREHTAYADAELRKGIMSLTPPVSMPPERIQQGVSRETRRAVADYLNRPL